MPSIHDIVVAVYDAQVQAEHAMRVLQKNVFDSNGDRTGEEAARAKVILHETDPAQIHAHALEHALAGA